MAAEEPTKEQPEPQPEKPAEPEAPLHRAHTFEDDVSKAMNAVDAPVVQEMLATAREREETERLERIGHVQRHWYSFLSIILIILAAAGFGYAVYHYISLTVPLEHSVPVGVFKNTAPVVVSEATIKDVVAGLDDDTSLEERDPVLVPLVTDAASLTPISKQQFFDFIGAKPTEPFAYVMDTVRLGVMNAGGKNSTFIVLSVSDSQLASKEFLIAEPTMLQLFAQALGIDLSTHLAQIGKPFTGTYLYNLPVRMLTEPAPDTGEERTVILYGFATGNVIVIATDPAVLKAVSDTIVSQI